METNNLKEKLHNYQPTPDPDVWDGIQRSLHRRILVRRSLGAVLATAVVAVAAMVLIPSSQSTHSEVSSTSIAAHYQISTAVESIQPDSKSDFQNPSTSAHSQSIATRVQLPAENQVSDPLSCLTVTDPRSTRDEGLSESEIQQLLACSEVHAVKPVSHGAIFSSSSSAVPDVASPAASSLAQSQADPITLSDPGVAPEPDESALMIPNVFVPNDDNVLNRTFRIGCNTPLTSFKLFIYNRGGRLVYKTTDVNSYWDGTHDGTPVSQGAYVYVIYYSDKNGNPHTLKGAVTVLR